MHSLVFPRWTNFKNIVIQVKNGNGCITWPALAHNWLASTFSQPSIYYISAINAFIHYAVLGQLFHGIIGLGIGAVVVPVSEKKSLNFEWNIYYIVNNNDSFLFCWMFAKATIAYWKTIGSDRFATKAMIIYGGRYIYKNHDESIKWNEGIADLVKRIWIVLSLNMISYSIVGIRCLIMLIIYGNHINVIGTIVPFTDDNIDEGYHFNFAVQMICFAYATAEIIHLNMLPAYSTIQLQRWLDSFFWKWMNSITFWIQISQWMQKIHFYNVSKLKQDFETFWFMFKILTGDYRLFWYSEYI